MELPLLIQLRASGGQHGITLEAFYQLMGVSRQAVHKRLKVHQEEEAMMVKIASEVALYRQEKDRRAGSRSLYYNLGIKARYSLGVNKFERLMSAYGLTIQPLHVRVITTKSCLQSWNYEDLTDGLILQDINELVAGDLTYVSLGRNRYYLFCLTDVYSARIVGHCFQRRMRTSEAQVAADRWIALRGSRALKHCIHHTDGGSQYFSKKYHGTLMDLEVIISVAKNCLQNGYAEQRNGLIKYHLLPTVRVQTGIPLEKEIDRIIGVYNYERKQEALGWKSPVEFEEYISTLVEKPRRKLYSKNGNHGKGF